MSPLGALFDSFLFGLLHGILPDEHTWPITFSYAIGGANGKQGLKTGLYFSAAFTVQRMLLAEVAYLAFAPYLLSPRINRFVYVIVGAVMAFANCLVRTCCESETGARRHGQHDEKARYYLYPCIAVTFQEHRSPRISTSIQQAMSYVTVTSTWWIPFAPDGNEPATFPKSDVDSCTLPDLSNPRTAML